MSTAETMPTFVSPSLIAHERDLAERKAIDALGRYKGSLF